MINQVLAVIFFALKGVAVESFLPEFRTDVPISVPIPARWRLKVILHQFHFTGGIREFRPSHGGASVCPVAQDANLIFILKMFLQYYELPGTPIIFDSTNKCHAICLFGENFIGKEKHLEFLNLNHDKGLLGGNVSSMQHEDLVISEIRNPKLSVL